MSLRLKTSFNGHPLTRTIRYHHSRAGNRLPAGCFGALLPMNRITGLIA